MQNKTVDHIENAISTVDRVRSGCILLLANLFLMAFCSWGVYAANVALQLEQNGVTTEGIVVAMEESNTDGSSTWSPVVEFRVDGQPRQFDGGISSNPPQYKVGDRVTVRHDRTDPSRVQIDSWAERWLMPILLIPSMLIAAVVLNIVMLRSWRRGNPI